MTSMNEASRAASGIHGDTYDCTNWRPSTPTVQASTNTASRHGGDTAAGDPVGEVRAQGAPVRAVGNLMDKEGSSIGDYDLIEANEAFASQALADGDALRWDPARVNVHGGAIALGHPIGASGARVLVTLIHALADRGARRGLATLCLGGGDAVAMSVTRG